MFHEETNKPDGIQLSPKATFLLGLIGGILALCTIGFVILLSIVLKGSVRLSAAGTDLAAAAPAFAAAPSPTPTPTAAAPAAAGTVTPVSATDHIRGDKGAQVTLVEYSDFQCPYCQRFHPTMVQLMNEYKGKVRWVYRHFPLSFHPNALPAANASECANEQGKFWEFADELFANQSSESDAFYSQTAVKLGLNKAKFDSCYSAKKYQSVITADQASGNAAGITGTPGTIIIGKDGKTQLVPGAVPYEQLKQMVDAALK